MNAPILESHRFAAVISEEHQWTISQRGFDRLVAQLSRETSDLPVIESGSVQTPGLTLRFRLKQTAHEAANGL